MRADSVDGHTRVVPRALRAGVAALVVATALVPAGAAVGALEIVVPGAGAGAVDPTFAADGERVFGVGRYDDVVAVLPLYDGTTAVVGAGDQAVFVARFLPDGSFVPSYGEAGVAHHELAYPMVVTGAVAEPDGRVVVAGWSNDQEGDVLLVRLTNDGRLDPGFGTAGVVRVDLGDFDQVFAVARRVDGRLVAAGRRGDAALLVGFTAQGHLDPGFGTGGTATLAAGTGATLTSLGFQADGGVVAGGYGGDLTGDVAPLVVRTTATGVPDTTWGPGGRADLAASQLVSVEALVVRPDDHVVVAGRRGDGAAAVAGTLPSGKLDTSFGTGGATTVRLGDDTVLLAMAVDAQGRVVAAGRWSRGEPPGNLAVPVLVRLGLDGRPDPGFGCGGVRSTELAAPGGGVAVALAAQADGDLLVANLDFTDVTIDLSPTDVVLMRHQGTAPPSGYRVVRGDGGVSAFGAATHCGSLAGLELGAPVVATAADPDGSGYWSAAADGGVFAFDAGFLGSLGGVALAAPIVGMAADPDGSGYWLVAADGGVFAFGAGFVGSLGGVSLRAPIVEMAADPDGSGYWLVAADGGVFAFGAGFVGSLGGVSLRAPIVGMAADPDGSGYWLVAADGGVFAFGAGFVGSLGGVTLAAPVVGMAADPDGSGYWLAAADGGVFTFDAPYLGSTGGQGFASPTVGLG